MTCNCFDCPFGEDTFQQRLLIYKALNEEPNYDEIAYSIWCDKVGSKCGWYGYCEDAFEKDIEQCITYKKTSNKCTRKQQHNKQIQDTYSFTKRWWSSPYYEHDGRLIRSNFAWRTKSFYKKYANKQVRKYECEGISNGNYYKKVFNYQNMIN